MKITGWILILLLWCSNAFAQHQDARLWTSLMVRYEVNKKWKISLEEEARFYENISRTDKLNTELTVDYEISKILDAGALYRLISRPDRSGNFEFGHRFGGYLNIQKKHFGWTGSLKTSFEKTYDRVYAIREWPIPDNYVRVQGEISREFKNKKTEPYTNIEFWYRLPSGDQAFVDQYRFTAGIKHKLNKRNRVNIYYRLQQELQVANPLTAHIFGIGYLLTVRR